MTKRQPLPDMFVLDSLANDVESLDDILRILNSDEAIGWHKQWGRHFTREEVVQALARLVRADHVRVSTLTSNGKWLEELAPTELPASTFDDVWFALTPHGRVVHTNWDPSDQRESPNEIASE
jgi:hypothetical protein